MAAALAALNAETVWPPPAPAAAPPEELAALPIKLSGPSGEEGSSSRLAARIS